jgi:cell division protein FtsB
MSTRFKRPTHYRNFLIGTALIAFQAYLGYSAINGNFGIVSQKQMVSDIQELQGEQEKLQAQINAYRLRIDLFDPKRLDPDLLTEKARALLSMARPDDILIPLNNIN